MRMNHLPLTDVEVMAARLLTTRATMAEATSVGSRRDVRSVYLSMLFELRVITTVRSQTFSLFFRPLQCGKLFVFTSAKLASKSATLVGNFIA